jgi:hypothetical protein
MSQTMDDGAPVRSPRKGAQVGPVSELSVFLTVMPGHEEAVRAVFHGEAAGTALADAVTAVGSLHQARYVLFDNGTRLLVGTTFDGDWDVYIEDFAAVGVLDAWDTFLIHCEGYPDEGWRAASLTVEQVKEFLTANQVTAEDFWVMYPGATAMEIVKALALQQSFQQALDNPGAAEALQHPALQPLLEIAAD